MDAEPFHLAVTSMAETGLFWVNLVVFLVLLACSALVSGAEVALFGLNTADIQALQERKDKRPQLVLRLLEKPKKLLATILIANNAINIAIVLLFTAMGDVLFQSIQGRFFDLIAKRTVLDIALATLLILLFGEILPKIYANRNRIPFSLFMAQPIAFLEKLFTPLSQPMRSFSLALEGRLGRKKSNISIDHLSQALELTSEGDTTKEEKKILEGIVSFGNTDTKQVMRPRTDVFALSKDKSFAEVLQMIVKEGYSRVPVYEDHLDSIMGVLYVKDLLPYVESETLDWVSLVRAPYFVPENKKLDDLLLEFQDQKNHLAIVVDEYGGTSGIVTLEDVIEEIVGDISDEFDDEDLIYSKLDEFNYVFDGKTTLRDFYRVVQLKEEELFEAHKGESETIAGFVLEVAKGFPRRGEKVKFNQYQFVVESIDKKRLKQIKVTLPHET